MRWAAFSLQAPDLADKAQQLFEKPGVVLVGTVRADGSPRISPVEAIINDGELYLGMMPGSYKALDLARDPRCTIHNAVTDRTGSGGEFKLHGKVRPVTDPDERDRYGDALFEVIGWKPDGDFPLFAVGVETAALFITGETSRTVTRWRAGAQVEVFEQT
jgi:hypothetical protein